MSTSELLLLDVSSLERAPEDVDTDPIAHVIYRNVQRCYQTTTMFEMDRSTGHQDKYTIALL